MFTFTFKDHQIVVPKELINNAKIGRHTFEVTLHIKKDEFKYEELISKLIEEYAFCICHFNDWKIEEICEIDFEIAYSDSEPQPTMVVLKLMTSFGISLKS